MGTQQQVLPRFAQPEQNSLEARPGSLGSDSLAYFFSKLVPGAFGFATVPVLIRLIGVDQYGRLAVLLPLLMAFGGAGAGWLAQGMLRFHPTSRDDERVHAGFQQAVISGATLSLITTGAILCLLLVILGYGTSIALMGAGLCCSFLGYNLALTKLQSELRPAAVMKWEVLRSTAGFVLPVLLVCLPGCRNFQMALLGLALAYALVAFLTIWRGAVPKARGRESSAQGTPEMLPRLWRFGWAVGAWLLLFQILPLIDRSVIQRFAGYHQAGIYASLYEISVRSFSLLAFPLTQAAHPRIMRCCNEGNYSEAYGIIKRSVFYQLLIFLPLILLVFIFARRIVLLVLGFEDAGAASILPLLIIGGFLWQLALLAHKPLEIRQQTKAMLLGMAAVVVAEFAANRLLVPVYGFVICAYVVVGCSLLYLAIVCCLGRWKSPASLLSGDGPGKSETQFA
jgi:O-antigen/teichoic acid export membrane protein